jgi:hypothetical protein
VSRPKEFDRAEALSAAKATERVVGQITRLRAAKSPLAGIQNLLFALANEPGTRPKGVSEQILTGRLVRKKSRIVPPVLLRLGLELKTVQQGTQRVGHSPSLPHDG